MGTWGLGNFESDNAEEYLDTVMKRLVDEIKSHLSPEKLNEEDFLEAYGEIIVIPAIDILASLQEQYRSYGYIDRVMVNDWKREYLQAYDREDGMYSEEHTRERRAIIEATFERLRQSTYSENEKE
ncbi:MAG: DUF4259 domain-containing protein [Burkholderiales bacterium]|nr:DUF4259 domain-containing protein [Anaerolineae bacterium]